MTKSISIWRARGVAIAAGLLFAATAASRPATIAAQDAAEGSARALAPVDLTGYWVSIVTEDWRFRMVTAPKGDTASLPLNQAGNEAADAWDPDRDEAEGNQCKAYGAAAIMRMPTRVQITWEDDNTLKLETDAGRQTRLLRFGESEPSGPPTLQGHSVARWDVPAARGRGGRGGRGGGGRGGAGLGRGPAWASLKVETTNLSPGYLRKNGVPYSERTAVTDYFDRHSEDGGVEWFTVTTIVEDPVYLNQPFVTSSSFRREPDASKWNPQDCTAQ